MLARPDGILRIEGTCALVASVSGYFLFLHGHWGLFAVLILAPDLSLLGYATKNLRFAANLYNLAHNYALPVILGLIAWKWNSPFSAEIAAIWVAHIGMDRMLGFGLKYPQAFKPTHLQTVAVFRTYELRRGQSVPTASEGVRPAAGSASS
ncbi:MAG TPA: DUF4260 domain-containing protein [Acidobacteriaceae bacterium]|jgi:hypothetical protein